MTAPPPPIVSDCRCDTRLDPTTNCLSNKLTNQQAGFQTVRKATPSKPALLGFLTYWQGGAGRLNLNVLFVQSCHIIVVPFSLLQE